MTRRGSRPLVPHSLYSATSPVPHDVFCSGGVPYFDGAVWPSDQTIIEVSMPAALVEFCDQATDTASHRGPDAVRTRGEAERDELRRGADADAGGARPRAAQPVAELNLVGRQQAPRTCPQHAAPPICSSSSITQSISVLTRVPS